jgi:hypothetical protein
MPAGVKLFLFIKDTEKTCNLKKKTCNKKFCYDCLQKNFPSFWENRMSKDWKCPCCLNECPCSQCKKIWYKSKSQTEENKLNLKKSNTFESNEDSKDEPLMKEDSESTDNQKCFELYDFNMILTKAKINPEKLGPLPRPKVYTFKLD